MAMTVPHMQQRYTGYDFGQNTARNWLDAVRIKNQAEAEDRKINIMESDLAQRRSIFERMESERIGEKEYAKAKYKSKVEMDEAQKRSQQILSNKSGDFSYRLMKYIEKNLSHPLHQAILPKFLQMEDPERAAQRSAGVYDVEQPDPTKFDIPWTEEGQNIRQGDPYRNLMQFMLQDPYVMQQLFNQNQGTTVQGTFE